MIDKIIRFFSKEEKKEELTAENIFSDDEVKIDIDCGHCPMRNNCTEKNVPTVNCENAMTLPDYDENKDTILIIDDNEGMISFLKDDMDFFNDEGIINSKDVNILTIAGVHAAFTLELLYKKLNRLNIKWAIIDITLGGSKMTSDGNIKYTGVDVFEMIYNNNDDFKYLFYTGNNLNPYIKANEKLINQFNKITNDDIKNHVLFKTSMDINSRREYISKYLFGYVKNISKD